MEHLIVIPPSLVLEVISDINWGLEWVKYYIIHSIWLTLFGLTINLLAKKML